MSSIKKFKITRYDSSITKPPYKTIKIGEVDVIDPELKDLGSEFADNIRKECNSKGYVMKFYTSCYDDEYDFEVVVK